MSNRPKDTHPVQWSLLKIDHPRQLWALEQVPQTSPLSKRVTRALGSGKCPTSDLDLLWELAHELELYSRLDCTTAPPAVGAAVQETFNVTSKALTLDLYGDRIYRVLLRHSDGWWARLALRTDGALARDFQQDTGSQVTLQGKVQRVQNGIAVLGGILRRIEHG